MPPLLRRFSAAVGFPLRNQGGHAAALSFGNHAVVEETAVEVVQPKLLGKVMLPDNGIRFAFRRGTVLLLAFSLLFPHPSFDIQGLRDKR